MAEDPQTLIDEWVARPENTARTVLVTIFGDAIAPLTSGVWLAQLFQLTDVLGFSERLVRTSMTRLVSEGWLDNERVGRQSRYSLTEAARNETVEASRRIYHESTPVWSGTWAVAFIDGPSLDADVRDRIATHLGWHGFVALGRSVMASATVDAARARELCRTAAPDVVVPTGTFEFSDLAELVEDGFFDAALDLDATASAFRDLLAVHRRTAAAIERADGPRAFALRTMLVHDLRRVRLRSIDLPAALLPPDWPGTASFELAASLYPRLDSRSAPWLAGVLGLDDASAPRDRFDRATSARAG